LIEHYPGKYHVLSATIQINTPEAIHPARPAVHRLRFSLLDPFLSISYF
jgi:hypothetical protein